MTCLLDAEELGDFLIFGDHSNHVGEDAEVEGLVVGRVTRADGGRYHRLEGREECRPISRGNCKGRLTPAWKRDDGFCCAVCGAVVQEQWRPSGSVLGVQGLYAMCHGMRKGFIGL